MKKMIYLDAQEIERYQNTILQLRNEVESSRKEKTKLINDLRFLKDSGEEILVIVKDLNNDVYEYKSTEKELLNNLVQENKEVREKNDTISRDRDNIENQKQMLILKYHEMDNIYKNQIKDLNIYIDYLEDRSLKDRVTNKKKPRLEDTLISFESDNLQIPQNVKTIYTEKEMERLEAEVKSIKKPRGWHFKEEFEDSEGNIYHKGKLQPHLKKSK